MTAVNSNIRDSLLGFLQSDYWQGSRFIAATPSELYRQLQQHGLLTASKQLVHDFSYTVTISAFPTVISLYKNKASILYVLDRVKSLAFLTKDNPVASQHQTAVATMSDEEIVSLLKRRAGDIRKGEEIVVVRDKKDELIPEERWRIVTHPHFEDTGSDTQYYCVSNHGRLCSNNGKIIDSETCSSY